MHDGRWLCHLFSARIGGQAADVEKLDVRKKVYYATVALLLTGLSASADTFFNSRPAWVAATTGVITTIDFEGLAPDGGATFLGGGTGAGLTIDGVKFAVGPLSDGNAFIIGQNLYYAGNSVFSSQETSTATNDLLITLPGPATALGFDFGDFSSLLFTFTFSDGAKITLSPVGFPGLNFLGVTSALGITTVDITVDITGVHDDPINIDNFSRSVVSAVPEPQAWVLLATMLLWLGLATQHRARFSVGEELQDLWTRPALRVIPPSGHTD